MDVLRAVLLMAIHDAGPSGPHLDALGLLVKAWVWGWPPFMVKNKLELKIEGELASCLLLRDLDHNEISGTIEDTSGVFVGLDNLSKL